MQKGIIIRIMCGAVLFVSALFYPWWVIFLVAIMGSILFDKYYEVLVAGIVLDLLYSAPTPFLFDIPLVFTIGGVIVFGVNMFSKRFLRAV